MNRAGTYLLIKPSTLRHYFGALFLLLVLTQVGRSQSSTDGLTPPSLTPGSPTGSYSLTDFENVNLFNGNLNFHLPLVKIGGRGGAQTALVLKVETRWRIEESAVCSPCSTFFYPTYNWWTGSPTPGYGPGSLNARIEIQGDSSCATNPFGPYYSLLRLTFTAADGTEYELRDKQTNGQPILATACGQIPSRGTEFVTADGTSALFVSDNNIFDNGGGFTSGYLTLRDGTRYRIINSGVISDMRDRNGNSIHYDYDSNARISTVTDSLGRAVTIQYDQQASPYGLHDKLTYTGVGGFQRIVRVSRAFLSTVLRPPFQPQSTYSLFPELTGSTQQGSFDTYVVSAIWLPNDKSYSLLYNSYGELARVVLPTGGAIEYDWDAGVEPAPGGTSTSVWFPNIYRRVTERRSYPNGGTGNQYELRAVYGRQEYIDSTQNLADRGFVSVDQYTSGGTFLSRTKHYFYGYGSYAPYNPFTGSGVYYTPWKFGKEYQTLALDSSGNSTLRKTVNTWGQREAVAWWVGNWDDAPPNDPRIVSTETTLADVSPNKVSKRTFIYSGDAYNNQTAVEEYDYGSTTPPAHPIRRTETDYLQTASYLANNVHLLSLPSELRIYGVDSNGTKIEPPVARTQFFYDQSALVTRTGIVGLDPNFTSTKRGNLTTTMRWVDGVGISATIQYDIAGNVVSSTDPLGRQTTIGYADSFSDLIDHHTFAFPTSGTSPIPDTGSDPNTRHGSNTPFTASAVYDYNSGLPRSFTDANGKTTTYQFIDSLDRLTGIIRPAGGGSTSYDYGDNAGNLFVHSLTDLDIVGGNTRRMEGYQYFDGLGRSTRSFTYDGTANTPWIVADAHYDGASRVVSTSNPYRVASVNSSVPSCATCTTTSYDILGRVNTVTLPDGSIATTAYSNNTTTTTDPATKKRSTTNDGLGRLASVVENPGASPSYTTTYTYDLLNNLRKVAQGSQSRFFYYDALSRLRREKNPEQGVNGSLSALTDPVTQNAQWSIEYQYNDNVHLTKKIDPRNISITLGYDALNRQIIRTYSDSTPPVDYIYDGARVTGGIANSKGRLTRVLTSGSFASSYTYDAFDDMGRVLNTTQTVESNPSYAMSYQYNLAGALTSETYPSTKTYATTYDIAGSIAGLTGPNNKVYADSFTYAPHGGVAQMKLGNGLWEHANFNSRLQPTEIGIGTGQTGTASVDRLKLSLDYGTTDNNGNVKSQTITVPTIGSVSGTTLTQCYTYDEFNRLKTAEEKGAATCSGAVIWTQKFTYDQQGNRRFDTGTTIPVSFPNPTINTANDNRIGSGQGYVYDLAGNVKQDPDHLYTFDAEERQSSVDNGATGTYSYDGTGQRVKTVTSAGTTLYAYDATGRLIAEYTSGNPTGSGTSYITADALGSPRVITDQNQSVKTRHDYLPFGEEITTGYGSRSAEQGYGLDNLRQKFTAKERDVETGLDYFGARYYSSPLGRFTSVDPINVTVKRMLDPQLINLYSYAHNNPLAYIDPTGADTESEEEKRRKQQLEEQQRAERQKIKNLKPGDTYTVVLLGILSPEPNTPTAQAVLDPQNAGVLGDTGFTGLTTDNTSILPNDNGRLEATAPGQTADQDQVNIGVDLIRAADARGLKIQLITHSNGIKAANEILNAVGDVNLSNSLIIAPNTTRVSDLANVASHSERFTLVGSNKDSALKTPGAANLRMEVAVGNLKYRQAYGFTGSNFAYKQTFQSGHGAQHYFKALRDGPVKVYK